MGLFSPGLMREGQPGLCGSGAGSGSECVDPRAGLGWGWRGASGSQPPRAAPNYPQQNQPLTVAYRLRVGHDCPRPHMLCCALYKPPRPSRAEPYHRSRISGSRLLLGLVRSTGWVGFFPLVPGLPHCGSNVVTASYTHRHRLTRSALGLIRVISAPPPALFPPAKSCPAHAPLWRAEILSLEALSGAWPGPGPEASRTDPVRGGADGCGLQPAGARPGPTGPA